MHQTENVDVAKANLGIPGKGTTPVGGVPGIRQGMERYRRDTEKRDKRDELDRKKYVSRTTEKKGAHLWATSERDIDSPDDRLSQSLTLVG